MSEFSERRYVMHKDFVPPVSIEKFAAYLDGNLTEDGMNEIASAIHSDDSLQDIMSSCHAIDDTIANYEPLQLTVPDDIYSTDFEIPQIDDNDYLNIGDWGNLDVAACAVAPFQADTMGTEDDSFSIGDHIGLDEDFSDITSEHWGTDLSNTMSDGHIDFDNTDLTQIGH